MQTVITETSRQFLCLPHSNQEDLIIAHAIALIEQRVFRREASVLSPADVKAFLRLKLAAERNELFAVLFLDIGNRVIAYEELFRGSLSEASVYPRVVLSKGLEHNAAAIILAHNHPSGLTTPSQADKMLTTQLKSVLALVNIPVLDHFIIGEGDPFSFAEAGLI